MKWRNHNQIRRAQNAFRCGLAAGLLIFGGCVGHHTSSRTAHLLDDKVITERVQVALRRVSPSDFSRVHVETAGSVVTLSGSVPNAQASTKAAQVAQTVHAVRTVDNRLQVR